MEEDEIVEESSAADVELRKELIQKVIERCLPKYELHQEFIDELEDLIDEYPIKNVNFEPSTFVKKDE